MSCIVYQKFHMQCGIAADEIGYIRNQLSRGEGATNADAQIASEFAGPPNRVFCLLQCQ